MRDKLIELIRKAKTKIVFYATDGTPIREYKRLIVERSEAKDLADYLLENGVIILPCKIGDTVYRVCKKKYDVDGYGKQWEEDWGIVTNTFHLGMLYEIGKNVFLTREEAEEVLRSK